MDITHRNVITILRPDVFKVEYETSLVRNVGCTVNTWFGVGHMSRQAMLQFITVRFNEEVCCNSFRGCCGYLLSKPFKRRVKSHLPFTGIIRNSPYSPR